MIIVPNSLHFSGIIPGAHRPTSWEGACSITSAHHSINSKSKHDGSVLPLTCHTWINYCDIADAAKQSTATGLDICSKLLSNRYPAECLSSLAWYPALPSSDRARHQAISSQDQEKIIFSGDHYRVATTSVAKLLLMLRNSPCVYKHPTNISIIAANFENWHRCNKDYMHNSVVACLFVSIHP